MVKLRVLSALAWVAGLVAAAPSPAPIVGVQTRNFPGMSDEHTLYTIVRRLADLAHRRQDNVFTKSVSLDKSWTDATLFNYSYELEPVQNATVELTVEVVCVTCYVKGGATATLTVNGTFDFGDTMRNVTSQLKDEFKNMTETAIDSIGEITANVFDELGDIFDPDEEFEFEDLINFDNFTVDVDVDIDLPPLPEVGILFQIDSLDLYMLIDTTISASATYTIPLFKSQTKFGVSSPTNPDLEIGLFVTLDLILNVEGEISLRSGFHLLLEDPVGFKIALFGTDVSDLIFNGGKFEFLPVILLRGEVALKAVLRVGMHAGLSVQTMPLKFPTRGPITEKLSELAQFEAGVEVGVFAHVAEFLTNVTGGALLAAEEGCAFKIVEEYTLAVGAVAGATVAVGDHTWGPQPETTIPVFYTTLADICAITSTTTLSTPTIPTSTALAARQDQDVDLETHTLTTKLLETAIGCASPQLVICPASLQTTTIRTSTKTHVTALPEGVTPTFPASTALTVASTIPFGTDSRVRGSIAATSGAPVSYVPPPPPPPPESTSSVSNGGVDEGDGDGVWDDVEEVFAGETGGVSNKLIIGLSVGLGVPILAAFVASLVHWIKRRKYAPVPMADHMGTAVEYTGGYDSPMAVERDRMLKKMPVVAVGEVRR